VAGGTRRRQVPRGAAPKGVLGRESHRRARRDRAWLYHAESSMWQSRLGVADRFRQRGNANAKRLVGVGGDPFSCRGLFVRLTAVQTYRSSCESMTRRSRAARAAALRGELSTFYATASFSDGNHFPRPVRGRHLLRLALAAGGDPSGVCLIPPATVRTSLARRPAVGFLCWARPSSEMKTLGSLFVISRRRFEHPARKRYDSGGIIPYRDRGRQGQEKGEWGCIHFFFRPAPQRIGLF
jgi:hypothetical protein